MRTSMLTARREIYVMALMLGDEITEGSPEDGLDSVISALGKSAGRVRQLTAAGQTVASQMAMDLHHGSGVRWVTIALGTHDLLAGLSSALLVVAVQGLISALLADYPEVRIALVAPPPFAGSVGSDALKVAARAVFVATLSLISGVWVGVAAFVTSHLALLDNGAGGLALIYDSGDRLRPNNAGVRVIADAYMNDFFVPSKVDR